MKIAVVPADKKVRSHTPFTGAMPLNMMYEK